VAALRPRADEGGPRWLESEALRALNLVRPSVYQDTAKSYSNEEFEAAAARVLEFCRLRAAFVRSEVAKVTGLSGSSAVVGR
jgi:hypothetical protein